MWTRLGPWGRWTRLSNTTIHFYADDTVIYWKRFNCRSELQLDSLPEGELWQTDARPHTNSSVMSDSPWRHHPVSLSIDNIRLTTAKISLFLVFVCLSPDTEAGSQVMPLILTSNYKETSLKTQTEWGVSLTPADFHEKLLRRNEMKKR